MQSKLFALFRSFFFGAVFISFHVFYIPYWAGIRGHLEAPFLEPLRWLGLIPLLLGVPTMLSCVWKFGSVGEGTPAPFDPPRHLVIVGPYTRVRNPMYWGAGLMLLGVALLLVNLDWRLLVYSLVLILLVHLFVVVYEEPTLRRKFGEEYREYCARVPRWIPRLRAYSAAAGAAR